MDEILEHIHCECCGEIVEKIKNVPMGFGLQIGFCTLCRKLIVFHPEFVQIIEKIFKIPTN